MKKKNALCIVAHPDDETIWMGGTIMKNKDWNWTILSLCRKNDPDRSQKFRKVCKFYNAKSIISDIEDSKLEEMHISETIKEIKRILPKENYDILFTHGKNGEYGHLRHKEIHNAVKRMIKDNELILKEAYFFSYKMKNSEIPAPDAASPKISILNNKEFKDKINLITKNYGFAKNSFETLSCNKIESFTTS